MPQVTVIIATYNCSRVLQCALRSVCAQTYQDFEAWIVGDGCTDDSEAVVAAFQDPRLHWANLPGRVGSQYGPNNEGLARAQGRYIAYLGHDDLWFPWHLGTLVETIEREGADFAYAGVVCTGPHGPVEAQGDTKPSAQISAAPPSGWLHRRAIVETCGPWRDPQTEPLGVDVGFQARACLAGFHFVPSRKMSVIKFPAHWWRTYARRGDYLQEAYGARMADDPERLHAELLTDLVFAYARLHDAPSVRLGVQSAFRALQRKLGEWYGVHRWPLSQYLRRRSARRRQRALALRGLPTSTRTN